jgi:hypothetical protein
MKCLLHKLLFILIGGLVPALLYLSINLGFSQKAFSPAVFMFFYAAGIIAIFRMGLYGEVSGKINNRHNK